MAERALLRGLTVLPTWVWVVLLLLWAANAIASGWRMHQRSGSLVKAIAFGLLAAVLFGWSGPIMDWFGPKPPEEGRDE